MYRDNCTAHMGCHPSSQNTQHRDKNICRGASSRPKEDILNKAKPILELLLRPCDYTKMAKVSPTTDVQISSEKEADFRV